MALSDTEQMMLIAQQVGDVDPVTGERVTVAGPGHGGVIMQTIPLLWRRWAAKDALWPGLRSLYVERDAIDLVLGIARMDVDVAGPDGTAVRLSQRVTALQKQRDAVQAEIERQEQMLVVTGGTDADSASFAVGQISQTEPVMPPAPGEPPPGWPSLDASGPLVNGSPYWRMRREGPSW